MVTPSLAAYLVLVGLVAVERTHELVRSARNTRRLLARGGREVGRGHYRAMAAFHAAFLTACIAEVVGLQRPFPGPLGWVALAAVIVAQLLRYWAVLTLGERWTTRIVVVPGAALVTRGPYRFVRHPNYLAVVLELAALPLVHGGYLTAAVFSAGNALLLWIRIRAEEAALGPSYRREFSRLPRFIPGCLS